VFQFSCIFAFFLHFLSFKSDTENHANFDAVSSKRAYFDEVQFTPKLIIFGTHRNNLQIFKHNTLSELLLMQFYLFDIFLNCITGSDKNYASHCLWETIMWWKLKHTNFTVEYF